MAESVWGAFLEKADLRSAARAIVVGAGAAIVESASTWIPALSVNGILPGVDPLQTAGLVTGLAWGVLLWSKEHRKRAMKNTDQDSFHRTVDDYFEILTRVGSKEEVETIAFNKGRFDAREISADVLFARLKPLLLKHNLLVADEKE